MKLSLFFLFHAAFYILLQNVFSKFVLQEFDHDSVLKGQQITKTTAIALPKSTPLPNSKKVDSISKSKLKRPKRQLRPPNRNPPKPGPNNKQTQNKGNGTPKSVNLFGSKNKGERCTSNQECFSTNCVFPGETAGKQPKPKPKPKPNRYGSRSISSRANNTISNPVPKPNPKPVTGTCQAEIEQDPVPKECPVGFKGSTKTYKESIRTKSSIVFRNFDSLECAEICRESPGCESFLYRQDMKLDDPKDEENGCFLYYESSEVPANQFKRIGPKVQSYNEIACEKLSYQKPCRKDQDCRAVKKCIKPPPDPKKPAPKGTIVEKVCQGTQKLCKTPNDCSLGNCNKQKCNRPKMELKCLSHEDCKLPPKCKVNPEGKKLPNKPKPKVCQGNDAKECTNDINCKVKGCNGKKCSYVEETGGSTASGDVCTKCVKDSKYKEYYQIQCANFDEYLKCQSKCVASKEKSPFKCIQNPSCLKNCESSCKKLWPASIPYDAYCSMIDYILESAAWNPYDDRDMVRKWMATNYIVRKEKGELKKDCMKRQVQSRSVNEKPIDWRYDKHSGFDDRVQVWDITMEELEEAYKTTAMKRHLTWTSTKTYGKTFCTPIFKRQVQAGLFMRRIFWLFVDDGCKYRADLFSNYLTDYLKEKFQTKNFDHPKKHFIFGRMIVPPEKTRNGIYAEWHYHVVLAVKITNSDAAIENPLLILDPALSSTPMTKENFHQMFHNIRDLSYITGFVTCDANTISINDMCVNPTEKKFHYLQDREINIFLDREWDQQKSKGRNPGQVLGDNWKKKNYYVFDD